MPETTKFSPHMDWMGNVWEGTDPRILRDYLDVLDTVLSKTRRLYDETQVLAHNNEEAVDDFLPGLSDLITELVGRMERMREAIDNSPEGREAARREQPRRVIW